MYRTVKFFKKRQFFLFASLLFSTFGWGQTVDLKFDTRAQITSPPEGAVEEVCSDSSSNLTFYVVNNSSGVGDDIDLAANNLIATLTLTGNTFLPSQGASYNATGTVATATFDRATVSSGSTIFDLPASGSAEFDWPAALGFIGSGITTVTVEVAIIGNTDPDSTNNSTTYEIEVFPKPSARIISDYADDTICQGEFPIFTAIPANDDYTYDFYIDGIYQNIGVNTNTFDTSLTTYTLLDKSVVSVVISTALNCTSTSSLTMRVLSITGTNSIEGSASICVGEVPATLTSSGVPSSAATDTTLSYQWQSSIAGGNFANIPGATELTFTSSALSTTTVFRRITYVTLGTKTCPTNATIESAASNAVTITVNTNTIAGSLVSDQPSNTVCSDDPGAITFTASPSGATSYEFFVNSVSVQSSTAQTYVSSSTNFTDGSIVSVRFYNASGCFTEERLTVAVNSVSPGSITGAQTVCFGDIPLILTSTVSAVTNGVTATNGDYQWQSSFDGVAWNDILGATSANYQPPAAPPPAIYYRRQVISVSNGVSCTRATNDILVSIDALPVPGLTAKAGAVTAAATMSLCSAEQVSFIGSGGVEYEFLVNGATVQSRSTSNTFITSSLLDTDEVTVMVFDSASVSACYDLSEKIEVEIAAEPVASLSSNATNDTFCIGDSVTFTAGSGGINPAYYEFKIDNFTYQNTTSSTFDPADYAITLSGGELIEVVVSSMSSCTSVASITMKANIITSVGTITSSTATVCSGDLPAPLIAQAATASGAITYQWKKSLDNVNYATIAGATSQNYTPTVALVSTTFYQRFVYSTVNSVTCSDKSLPFQVVVSPSPLPGLSALPGSISAPATLNLCEGEAAIFSGSGGASYEFFVNGTSVAPRSTVNSISLTGNVSGTLINNSSVVVRVYDTATATSCFEDSAIITVFVNPTPTVGLFSNKFNHEICTGDSIIFTANSTAASPSMNSLLTMFLIK